MPTVLIVDRLHERGELLAQGLERHGWETIVAASFPEARRAAGQIRMHVVLVDQSVAEEKEVVEAALAADQRLARTPLVYLSDSMRSSPFPGRRLVLARDCGLEAVHAALMTAIQNW